MRAVALDISGAWGLFRKPYAPMSPVSFPLPPPTALMGLVGAVCGYEKHEYHELIGWREFLAGVRLCEPVRTYQAAINLLNTRDKLDRLWRPNKDSHRIQIPFEFLVEPSYRVWLTGMSSRACGDLVDRLSGPGPVYTPVLGLANCMADVRLVSVGALKDLGAGPLQALRCAVPLGDGVSIEYDSTRPYERLRVPGTMAPTREVSRYPEIVVATDAGPVEAAGVPRYQLGDDVFCLL